MKYAVQRCLLSRQRRDFVTNVTKRLIEERQKTEERKTNANI